jgi:hypothetical protein
MGVATQPPVPAPRAVAQPPEPEVVDIRGQQLSVWPVEDLRRRGFDIAEVPREQNAAWLYVEAANTYEEPPAELSDALEYAAHQRWPDNVPDLARFLSSAANREAMDLCTRASRMDRCQVPYFGDPGGSVMMILLPNLAHVRSLSRLLTADGHRLEAEGNLRGATERYLTVLRMGSHTAEGLTLIETLVGVATWALGNGALQDMLTRHDLPAEDIRALLDDLGGLSARAPDMRRALRFEKQFAHAVLDEFLTKRMAFMDLGNVLDGRAAESTSVGPSPPGSAGEGWSRLEERVARLLLPDRAIKRHIADYYGRLQEAAAMSAIEAQRAWPDLDQAAFGLIPRWDVILRILAPSLTRAVWLGRRADAEARATRVIAALRWQAASAAGTPPDALDALKELLSPEAWQDPFGEGPFTYRREGSGWVLYSRGENLRDDGGVEGERHGQPDRVWRFQEAEPEPFEAEE